MVLPAAERPDHLRMTLLSYPNRIVKKYVAPVFKGRIFTGVKRSAVRGKTVENWRINMLAIPAYHKITPKYVYVEPPCTGVRPSALTMQATPRTIDLSKPTVRYLDQSIVMYNQVPILNKNLTKTLQQSWNTIYYYYRKQLKELQKKKEAKLRMQADKIGKSAKELQAERDKRFNEWCVLRSEPKRYYQPPEPVKKPIADMRALLTHLSVIAEPKTVTKKYMRPSIDPTYIDPLRVTPGARSYVASERVLELSKSPAYKLIKEPEIIPGAVKRGALKCAVSPRFDELATPKKKAAQKDSDLNENAFTVSPTALKFKTTARLKELAKPIDR